MTAKAGSSWIPSWWEVTGRKRETHDVVSLSLAGDEAVARAVNPGQFFMVYVFGVGEIPISVSAVRPRTHHVVLTVRDVGAVSRSLAQVPKRSFVGLRGPFGSHWPLGEAEGGDLIIMAGGLGIAPLRMAVQMARKNKASYQRVFLLYGARGPQEIVFADELERWSRDGSLHGEVTVDHAPPSWNGHVGVVPHLLKSLSLDPERTTAFLCGPEIMMRFSGKALAESGVPRERIFFSMERNMKCAVGACGHCMFGPEFVCRDGPIFPWKRIERFFSIREF